MPRLNVYLEEETFYMIKRIALDNNETLSEFIRDMISGTIDAYTCANGNIKKMNLDSIQMEKK